MHLPRPVMLSLLLRLSPSLAGAAEISVQPGCFKGKAPDAGADETM